MGSCKRGFIQDTIWMFALAVKPPHFKVKILSDVLSHSEGRMWPTFIRLSLFIVFQCQGSTVSAEVGDRTPCGDTKVPGGVLQQGDQVPGGVWQQGDQVPGGVWQQGCLVKTCNSGAVEESLAEECLEMIEKKVDEILLEKLPEKGWELATKNETATEAVKYQTGDHLYLGNNNMLDLTTMSLVADCTVPPFPVKNSQYMISQVVDGSVTVCGGSSRDDPGAYLRSCYSLVSGVWVSGAPMMVARSEAAGSMTKEGWLVTGGRLSVSSTEYYRGGDGGGEWVPGPPLPHYLYFHCQVTVNNTVYILGGKYQARPQATVYILRDGKWVEGQRMRHPRSMAACVEFENSIWVIGGDSVITVERLDLVTMTWHKEPDLWIYPYATNAVVYNSTIYLVHYAGMLLKLNTDNHRWERAGEISSPGYRPVYPAPRVTRAAMGC